MKLHYLLGGVFSLAILFPIQAQDQASSEPTNEPMASARDTVREAPTPDNPEFATAIFYKGTSPADKKGCSLIQNKWRDRKIYNTKNGYRIETADQDEVITVKHTKGGQKIRYYNEYETLYYHLKNNGKLHYVYDYTNECKKVRMERRKNGITSLKNKSGMDMAMVRNNVRNAIDTAVQSCGVVK
jgi:hypothetical protein